MPVSKIAYTYPGIIALGLPGCRQYIMSMGKTRPELIFVEDLKPLITLFTLRAAAEGYFVLPPSMQLSGACGSFVDQICPHDGQLKCECQAVITHIENDVGDRLALVFHTRNSTTEIYIDSDLIDTQDHFINSVHQILHEEIDLVYALSRRFSI